MIQERPPVLLYRREDIESQEQEPQKAEKRTRHPNQIKQELVYRLDQNAPKNKQTQKRRKISVFPYHCEVRSTIYPTAQ